MPKLVIAQDGANVAHELVDEMVTIGRAPENMIQLDDPSVSGRHAQLRVAGADYELVDLNSTNGTRVNGVAITTSVLRPRDQIRFGKVEACYECETPGEAQPLPVTAAIEARPAESSAQPADFGNASPFMTRTSSRDPVAKALFVFAAAAILALIGSLLALAQMRAPLP